MFFGRRRAIVAGLDAGERWLATSLCALVAVVVNAQCLAGDCATQYSCTPIDDVLHKAVNAYTDQAPSFTSSCSCLSDWNSLFCNYTQTILSHTTRVQFDLPTICICRTFTDSKSKCHQFISRCYPKEHGCSCCFNQPQQYCDHIECKNNEPQFGKETICSCHHSATDYPYEICKASASQKFTSKPAHRTAGLLENSVQVTASSPTTPQKFVTLLGVSISTNLILYVALALIGIVVLLTALLLIVGNKSQRKRRQDLSRQRQAAHEALLMQRAEDDRYLPTV